MRVEQQTNKSDVYFSRFIGNKVFLSSDITSWGQEENLDIKKFHLEENQITEESQIYLEYGC